MSKILVFDLPVRVFHWLLAALFLGAFVIGTTVDDESSVFAVHALLGAGAGFLVLLRLVWGLVGTRHARFGSLSLGPRRLVRHLTGALAGRGEAGAGHNPATSWFMLLTFAVVLGLGLTGYRLGRGDESAEELHEALAWAGIALAGIHVAGIAWHLARRRENLAAAMVTGRKTAPREAAIRSARPVSALVLLALVAGFGAMLVSGFDARAGKLSLPLLPGAPLTIGEAGGDAGEGGEGGEGGAEAASLGNPYGVAPAGGGGEVDDQAHLTGPPDEDDDDGERDEASEANDYTDEGRASGDH